MLCASAGDHYVEEYERLRLFKINATVCKGEAASYAMKCEKLKENVAEKNKENGENTKDRTAAGGADNPPLDRRTVPLRIKLTTSI